MALEKNSSKKKLHTHKKKFRHPLTACLFAFLLNFLKKKTKLTFTWHSQLFVSFPYHISFKHSSRYPIEYLDSLVISEVGSGLIVLNCRTKNKRNKYDPQLLHKMMESHLTPPIT